MSKTLRNHRFDLVLIDLLTISLVLMLLLLIEGSLFENWLFSIILLLICSISWAGVSILQKIYKWKERVRFEKEIPFLLLTILSHFAILIVVREVFLYKYFSSTIFIIYLITLLIVFPLVRLILRLIGWNKAVPFNYILVGGKGTNIKHIFKTFNYVYQQKANCLGRFGNTHYDFIKRIGGYPALKEFIQNAEELDKVFYVYSELPNDEVREIMRICQNRFIDFEIIPRETDIFPRGVNVEFHDDLPILTLKEEPLFRMRNKILKRIFDLIFSSLVLIIIFPLMYIIVGILIKLESRGPIFFIQDRSGYKGKPFPCFKFRTMTVNQDADKKQATKNDSRITKIGAFLRKTSLDEFPQFINVFLGHMSVVGPRPHMLSHTEEYAELINDFMIRHKIKPGITGWAQVNGYRGPTEELYKMEKRVQYDVWYIENWSFLLDLKCVLHTVLNAAKGEENAF